jgi:hypothetical protein
MRNIMSPIITEQQRQALHEMNDAGPVTVIDPISHAEYVLVRADIFGQLQTWMSDMEPHEAYPMVDQIMALDDAHDPTLETYQDNNRSRGAE